MEAMCVQADREREDAGSEQRDGRDDADLERRISELQQVHRQEQAHVAVAEGAQPLRHQEAVHVRRIHFAAVVP